MQSLSADETGYPSPHTPKLSSGSTSVSGVSTEHNLTPREKRRAELDARLARTRELLLAGKPRKHIMQLQGLSSEGLRAAIQRLRARYPDDVYQASPDQSVGLRTPGLTDDSALIRRRLAQKVWKIRDNNGAAPLSRHQIAEITGINVRDQKRASEEDPYDFDFNLSHMERIAHYSGQTIVELFLELAREPGSRAG